MRLSVKGLASASGITWGVCLFVVGLIHLAAPAYGEEFLRTMSSVYPGFHIAHNFANVIVGAVYGLVDGFIGGAIFAWLYNFFAGYNAQARTARLDMNRAA